MPIDSLGNAGLGVAGLSSGGLTGRGLAGGGGDAGVSIRTRGILRGRRGQAIPTGLVMPEARGGTSPYTYTMTDLPGGVTFTAGTRTLSGTPSAAGDFTPTYTVTDSSTPALTASRAFDWSVLDFIATDPIMLQDFDSGAVGYGLSEFVFAYADTLVSGEDLGFNNEAFWASAPRVVIGSIVDDPFAKRLLPTGAIMSRLEYRPQANPDEFRMFDSNQDLDGNTVDSDIGAWGTANTDLNLYLQRTTGNPGVTLSFGDIAASAVWNVTLEVNGTQSSWIRNNLNDGNEFIMVIAEAP